MIQLVEERDVKEKREKTNIVHDCPQCKGFIVKGEEYYRTKISEWDEKGRHRYFHTRCLEWKLRKELVKNGCKDMGPSEIDRFLKTDIVKEYIERRMREDYEFITEAK